MNRVPCYTYKQIQKNQYIKPSKYIELKGDDEFFAILKAGPYIQSHENCYGYLIHILPDDDGDYACFPVKLVEKTYLQNEHKDFDKGICGRWIIKNKYIEFVNPLKDFKNFEKQKNYIGTCYKKKYLQKL